MFWQRGDPGAIGQLPIRAALYVWYQLRGDARVYAGFRGRARRDVESIYLCDIIAADLMAIDIVHRSARGVGSIEDLSGTAEVRKSA